MIKKKNLHKDNHRDFVISNEKDYKTVIPQSKILKKVEFQKPL